MRNLLTIAFLALATAGTVAQSVSLDQTNAITVPKTWVTELTLSGSGVTTRHGTEFGLSFSYETNPLKPLPSLWFEVIQSVGWQPDFAGSTDFVSEWSFPIYKDVLFINAGWNFGSAYDTTERPLWRTGPEFNFQYFVGNSAFVYAGLTFDCFVSRGDLSVRPGFGFGITF